MISRSPGVVFAMQFVQSCDSPNGYGGYTNYMNRPEAFVSSDHQSDPMYANGFLDYMRDDDKSDGLFSLMHDHLSESDVLEQADLFNESWKKDCPLYQGVISFDNDFLKEHRMIKPDGSLDLRRLKDVARKGAVSMLQESHLDIDNVIWNGAIHTNTDNVHVHLAFVEREKVQRRFDRIEVPAFDKLKSVVANQIIGDENICRISDVYRKHIIPGLKDIVPDHVKEVFVLLDSIPEDIPLQYKREKFQPYQRHVNAFIRKMIDRNPELKTSFDEVSNLLDEQQEVYRQVYGDGQRHLWQNYKGNKEKDFYARAGNAVLSAIKDSGLREQYSEYKRQYPPAGASPESPGFHYPRKIKAQSFDDYQSQRRAFTGLSRTADGVVRRSLRDTQRHVRQLLAEYEREQERKIGRN